MRGAILQTDVDLTQAAPHAPGRGGCRHRLAARPQPLAGRALQGYQVWADSLKPILTELQGQPASIDLAPPPTGGPSRNASGDSYFAFSFFVAVPVMIYAPPAKSIWAAILPSASGVRRMTASTLLPSYVNE